MIYQKFSDVASRNTILTYFFNYHIISNQETRLEAALVSLHVDLRKQLLLSVS